MAARCYSDGRCEATALSPALIFVPKYQKLQNDSKYTALILTLRKKLSKIVQI